MLKEFFPILFREVDHLRRNPWDASLLTWIPGVMFFFLGWMFVASSPSHLPIVIADADQSAVSRQLTRMLNASSGVAVVAEFTNFEEAKEYVRTGKAYAAVYIPENAQRDLHRGKQATIFSFFNESYYTAGGLTSRAISATLSALSAETAPGSFKQHITAATTKSGAPLRVQVAMLFNPQLSYELGLLSVIFPVLIHVLLIVSVTCAVGREVPPQVTSPTYTNFAVMVLGKVFFYATVYLAISTLCFVWLTVFQGWPVRGSFAFMMLAQWVMLVGYGFIGVIFLAISKNVVNQGLSIGVIYGGPAIAFCDALFPTVGASLFVKFWSNILPYTIYVKLQNQQYQMGSPLRDSMTGFLTLLLVAVIAYPLSVALLKRTTRKVLDTTGAANGATPVTKKEALA